MEMTREWRKLQNPYLVYCKHFESYSALEQIKVNTLVVFMVRSVWDHFSTLCWFESTTGYAFILGLSVFCCHVYLHFLQYSDPTSKGEGRKRASPRPEGVWGL